MEWRTCSTYIRAYGSLLGGAVLAVLSQSACLSSVQSVSASCALPVTIAVTGSERLNPDEHGQPLPTVVRLFQLTRTVRIETADFEQLWEQPDQTLGDTLIQKQELTIFPDEEKRLSMELDANARFLVGMGIFRQPTGNQWRAIVPLPPSERICAAYLRSAPVPALSFVLDGYRVEARSQLLRSTGQVDLPSAVTSGDEALSEQPVRP